MRGRTHDRAYEDVVESSKKKTIHFVKYVEKL